MSAPSEHEDLGIVLAMVYMSWADQSFTEQEVELIRQEAQNQGLDEQELSILAQVIHEPPSLETVFSYLPSPESRKAAVTAAYISALADHSLTSEELEVFNKMCSVLELSDSEREEIRAFGNREVPLTKAGDWQEALFLENLTLDD